uniref:Protein YIPF n=3 Tax=Meloidogyne TaxID=189290 RepID=A0A914LD74_MELIC
MTSNLSFAIDLEQLEKEIQQSEQLEGSKQLKSADLSGNIGGRNDSKKVLGNTVQFDCEFDTLDESIRDTLNRDLKILYEKFSQVLFPQKNEMNVLADWDLWGPLFICVLLSLLLQGAEKGAQFTQIFSLAFFGSLVVTLNAKLLGGKISFFQSLCVIGYCLLPFVFSSIGIKSVQLLLIKKIKINLIVRLVLTVIGLGWAYYASTKFMSGSQPPKRKILSYYPLMLFYFVFAWLVISYA